jgi:hypothetical protein
MTDWLQGEAEIVLGRNVIEPKLGLIQQRSKGRIGGRARGGWHAGTHYAALDGIGSTELLHIFCAFLDLGMGQQRSLHFSAQ